MKLHISPIDMQMMAWYDISLLYKRYERYVEEENAQTQTETTQQEDYMNVYNNNINNMTSNFNMDNLTRGFSGIPGM